MTLIGLINKRKGKNNLAPYANTTPLQRAAARLTFRYNSNQKQEGWKYCEKKMCLAGYPAEKLACQQASEATAF